MSKIRHTKASFFSEHTAEYILVPNIINSLSHRFPKIIPFYFWSGREGNAMSRWSGKNENMRLVIVFPRRPKINYPYQNEIMVTFHDSLFEVAQLAEQNNIPTLAGVPLVSSIFDLELSSKCAWFKINTSFSNPGEIILDIPSAKLTENYDSHVENVMGPLTKRELITYISNHAKSKSWATIIDTIREIKFLLPTSSYFGGFGGYRPFYLAVFDRK